MSVLPREAETGWIIGEAQAAELDDSRRRYYRLTRMGRRVLAAECARLEDLIRAVHARRGVRERKADA